jgi:hypothetical protein
MPARLTPIALSRNRKYTIRLRTSRNSDRMRGTAKRASRPESTKIMNTRITANAMTSSRNSRTSIVIVGEPSIPWKRMCVHRSATPIVATIAIPSIPWRRSGGNRNDRSTTTSDAVANMIASCSVSGRTTMVGSASIAWASKAAGL